MNLQIHKRKKNSLILFQRTAVPEFLDFGLFTSPDTDSATNLGSDSKPDGYILQCRNCSHCTGADSDSDLDLDTDCYCSHFGTNIYTQVGICVI